MAGLLCPHVSDLNDGRNCYGGAISYRRRVGFQTSGSLPLTSPLSFYECRCIEVFTLGSFMHRTSLGGGGLEGVGSRHSLQKLRTR